MKRKTRYLSAFFAIIILYSCTKNTASSTKSRAELLTKASWRRISYEEKTGANGNWKNNATWAAFPSCRKDDIFVYRPEGYYNVREGATKCSPTDQDHYSGGNWSFQDNESKLKLDNNLYTIEKLDEDTFKLLHEQPWGSTTIYYRSTEVHD